MEARARVTDLSLKDYVVVKAKLPHEELYWQGGDLKGEPLGDDELMKRLTDYYMRESMVKRLRKFKKDLDDLLAILEPTVLR